MIITIPTARLSLTTQSPTVVTTYFVAVYTATMQPVMMSIDAVVAVARGPPLVV